MKLKQPEDQEMLTFLKENYVNHYEILVLWGKKKDTTIKMIYLEHIYYYGEETRVGETEPAKYLL